MIKAQLVSLVLSTTAIIRQRKQQLQTLVLLLTLLPFIITTTTTDKGFWNKFSSTKKLNCLWLVWFKFCLAYVPLVGWDQKCSLQCFHINCQENILVRFPRFICFSWEILWKSIFWWSFSCFQLFPLNFNEF